jgi:hypothetical protein
MPLPCFQEDNQSLNKEPFCLENYHWATSDHDALILTQATRTVLTTPPPNSGDWADWLFSFHSDHFCTFLLHCRESWLLDTVDLSRIKLSLIIKYIKKWSTFSLKVPSTRDVEVLPCCNNKFGCRFKSCNTSAYVISSFALGIRY